MTNSSAQVLISLLTRLQSSTDILEENLANKKSSTSFEELIQIELVKGGFQDLSEEWVKCKKGMASYFSNESIKRARLERHKTLKSYVNEFGGLKTTELRRDVWNHFPKNCFVRHPNGSQDSIDFLIVVNGYMLYFEIKTGGGLSGKLNDKPIPAQFFVIMCSRHKEVADNPYTFFQMGDMMSDETYNYYLAVEELTRQQKVALKNLPYSNKVKQFASKASARTICGWGKENNDWYRKSANGLSRQDREANVLSLLSNL